MKAHRGGMDQRTPYSTLPPPPTPGEPPPRPPGRQPRRPVPPEETARSAALWLGGTGAFLLLVAAAVLVAVRWDDLTAWMKLAGLVITNAGVIGAGLRHREFIPATARALYHLGGLLLPVSAIAVALQTEVPWQWTLVGTSVVTIGGISWLNRLNPSGLLRGIAMAAVVPLAGGLASVSGAPAAVILGSLALTAIRTPLSRQPGWTTAATLWAALAGLLALFVGLEDPFIETSNLVSELGLGAPVPPWGHLVGGIVAALALATVATRRNDEGLALAALATALIGATAAAIDLDTNGTNALTTMIGGGIILQLAAVSTRNHPLWSRVFNLTGILAEIMFAFATYAVAAHAFEVLDDETIRDPSAVVGAALLSVGWLIADQRRRLPDCQSLPLSLLMGSGFAPATLGLAGSVLSLVALSSQSIIALSWASVALAAALVVSARGGAHTVAAALCAVGVVYTNGGWHTVAVAALGAVVLTGAAALRTAMAPRHDLGAALLLGSAIALIAGASMPLAFIDGIADEVGWAAFIVAVALATVGAERGSRDPISTGTGLIGRGAMIIPFVPIVLGLRLDDALPAVLLAGAFLAVDSVRTRDTRLLFGTAVFVPAGAILFAQLGDLTVAQTGVALAVLATAGAGAMIALGHANAPLVATATTTAVAGLFWATGSPMHLSTTLLILGGGALMIAADRTSLEAFGLGALATTIGLWIRLELADVAWSEAYLAPVAVSLIVLGIATRDRGMSSWWTHGTAVLLLGGAGLIERIADGTGGHALLAGAIATFAITAGAQQRLIGPLMAGTAVIVGIAGHESLAYAASVPTWAWLALAGATLLACGVAIERTATSPLESGRTAVKTIHGAYR